MIIVNYFHGQTHLDLLRYIIVQILVILQILNMRKSWFKKREWTDRRWKALLKDRYGVKFHEKHLS